MSAGKESSLSLVLRLVDKATGPLAKFGHRLKALNEPGKRLGKALHEIGEQSGLFRVGEALKGVGEGFHRVAEKAFEFGKELALITLEAGFVAYEVIHHFTEIGDALKKTSGRLGLTVDGWAELAHVAKMSGIPIEEFTGYMDRFNRGMGEAKVGTGNLLKALGHTPAAFKAQVLAAKDNEAALDLIFAALTKIKDPTMKAAFATEVFGKSAGKMVDTVKEGPEGVKKLRAEYRRIAGDQTKFADTAEILSDAMDEAKAAFGGLAAAAVSELFPALTELSGVVKEFLIDNREGVRAWARDTAGAITAWVKGGGIQRLADGFKSLLAAVSPIVQRLGGWPTVLAGIAAAITAGPLLAALAGLGASFVTLGLAMMTTPFGWVLAGVAALAAGGVLIYANWDKVAAFFKEFFPNFSKGVADSVDGLKTVITWTEKLIDVWKAWKNMQEIKAGDAKGQPQTGASKWFQDAWDSSTFGGALNALTARPTLGADAARGPVGGPPAQARVTIDVKAPKGTRSAIAPGSTADVDLNTGVSMAGAN